MKELYKVVRQLGGRYDLTPARWGACGGLAVCAVCLSWRLGLGGSAGTLLLFAGLFWLARREWQQPSPGYVRGWTGVFALLFSCALSVARLVRGCTDIEADRLANYIEWDGRKDILLILPLAVFLWLVCLQLRRLAACHPLQEMQARPGSPKVFCLAWGLIFLCWIPFLLAFWPAGLVGDGAHTMAEALGHGAPSGNHWVVLYILTLRFFIRLAAVFGGGLSAALCLYAVAQSLAFSAACAAVVYKLYTLGVPRLAVTACGIMYGCSGFFATYGMAVWKDTLFSAAVVLLALQLWDFSAHGISRRGTLGAFALMLFLCFWRNNGIYVVAPTLLVLLIACRGKARRLLAAGAVTLVLTAVIQGPVYDALGIGKDSLTESISVPLQQLAATINEDRPLTEEQQQVLFTILPEEVWRSDYEPCLSDPLKSSSEMDTEYLETHFGDFLGGWAQLLPANLDVYVEAYLLQTLGFWKPGSWLGYYYDYFVGIQDLYGYGITGVDWFQTWFGHGLSGVLEQTTRFVSSGTMVWVLLGAFFFCLCKPKGRRRGDLLLLTPLLFSWLSLMVAVPIAQSYRYILMLPLALPVLCLLFVYDRPDDGKTLS